MNAMNFKPIGASIQPSQMFEVMGQKQSLLAGIGQQLRDLFSQLSPDIVESLLQEYREPDAKLMTAVEAQMIERELLVNIDEASLDKTYFNGEKANPTLDTEDEWNKLGL